MFQHNALRFFLAAASLATLHSLPLGQSCGTVPKLESVDSGNTGAFGALTLSTDSRLLVDSPFDARVENGFPGAHGCIAYSLTEALLPLPKFSAFFHPGLPASFVNFQLDGTGQVDGLLPLAAIDPSFCGTDVFMQAVTTDPSSPGGVGVSNALRIRIGDVSLPRFAYVHDHAGKIVAFLTDPNGVVVGEHPDSPFASGGFGNVGGCFCINNNSLIEVDGILYAANNGTHDVAALRIEADGALTPLPGSPFPAGGFTPRSLTAHPSLDILYVANDTNGTVGILAIAPDGSLSEAFPPVVAGANGMMNIEMHPSGKLLWTSWRHNASQYVNTPMEAFAIGVDGDLIALGSFGTARPYAGLAVTPSGDHFYAATSYGGLPINGVYAHEVLLSPTIALPSIPGAPFPNSAENNPVTTDIAASVDGRFLFAFNNHSPFNTASIEHIHSYAIDEVTGELTSVGTTPTPGVWSSPTIMEVSPDGTRLYTVSRGIETYEIDADGLLVHLGSSPSPHQGISTALGLVLVP